jgi:hypothetical protein
MPPVINKIQLFVPKRLPDDMIAQTYKQEGVVGLRNLGLMNEYRALVWRLAQQVVAISRAYFIEPAEPDLAALRNVFEEGTR